MTIAISIAVLVMLLYCYALRSVIIAQVAIIKRHEAKISELRAHVVFMGDTLAYAKSELSEMHFKWRDGHDVPHLIGSVNVRKLAKEIALAPDYCKQAIASKYEGGKLNF